MSDHPQLIRQWMLIRLLSSRHYGVSVRDMADELSVSDKTVRRDLQTIQEVGFPLEERVVEHGRKVWQIVPDNCRVSIDFNFDEALALYLGRRFLEPLATTPFGMASKQAFDKLRTMLGKRANDYLRRFEPLFLQTNVGVSDYSQKGDVIDAIMTAIEDRRALSITYQSLQATEPVTYRMHPYGLVYHHGALYLVGASPARKEICHWKVNRIENAEATRASFVRPADFDLQTHFAGSFGVFHSDGDVRVVVRFSAEVARYVKESKWHASQTLTPQNDGALLAEFHLSATEEIKRWILSFGRHARVLEPPELIEDLAAELDQMVKGYSRAMA